MVVDVVNRSTHTQGAGAILIFIKRIANYKRVRYKPLIQAMKTHTII